MRTVHLIHGFNERHRVQRPKIARLAPAIHALGFRVMVHDYGHWDLVATRNNSNLARLVYPHVAPGDTLVGFSNGAAICARVLALGAKAKRVVLIQPALAKRWKPPACVEQVTVFWNPGDRATVAGKWWRRVTSILPWRWQDRHNWGEMGHTGYLGTDPRFTQFNTVAASSVAAVASLDASADARPARGHSGWSRPQSAPWWKFIAKHC